MTRKKSIDTDLVPVYVDDLCSMLIGQVRYSMGRMTYIVGVACEQVRRYWRHVPRGQRDVLLRDVTEELDRAERMGHLLGMDFDHREWVSLREWMRENLEAKDTP